MLLTLVPQPRKIFHWVLHGGAYYHYYTQNGICDLRDLGKLNVFVRGCSRYTDRSCHKYGSVRGTLASFGLAQIAAKRMYLPEA